MPDYVSQLEEAQHQLAVFIDTLPDFGTVLDHQLLATFPRLPADSCTDNVFISYSEQAEMDQPQQVVSLSLTELIELRFAGAQLPAYEQGSTEVYDYAYTLDKADINRVITLPQAEEFVDFVAQHLELCLKQALTHHWQQTDPNLDPMNRRDGFAQLARTVVATENALRHADKTLSHSGHDAVKQILSFPTYAQRLQSPVARPSAIYAIALKGEIAERDIPLPGMFVIADSTASLLGDATRHYKPATVPPVSAQAADIAAREVVLYRPDGGLEVFESLLALSQELQSRLGDAYQRQSVLAYASLKDRERAMTLREFGYREIIGDVFDTYADQLLEMQLDNITQGFSTLRTKAVDRELETLAEQIGKGLVSSFTLDPGAILKARYTRLLESQLPQWLKQASEVSKQDWRLAVEQLNRERFISQTTEPQDFFGRGQKSSLLGYARVRLKEQIKADHQLDVDPDSLYIVTSEAVNTSPGIFPLGTSAYAAGASVSRTGPTVSYITTKRSLSDLALENVGKLDLTFALTAQIQDASGKRHPILKYDYIKQLVRIQNIGQRYVNLMSEMLIYDPATRFKSAQAQWRKERYVAVADAQLTLDLLEASLIDNPLHQLSGEEIDWIDLIRKHPVEKDRPLAADKRIKVHSLLLKGYELPGIWVITATPSTRQLCYTPDAPDKVWFRRVDSLTQLATTLSATAMRDYVLNRVTPAKQPYVVTLLKTALKASDLKLQLLDKHFQEKTYDIEASFAIRNADEQSTSTYESNVQTAKQVLLTAVDVISFVLPFKVLLPLVMARFLYSVSEGLDALARDEKQEALFKFLDSVAHLTDGASDFAGSSVFGRAIRTRVKPPSQNVSAQAASTRTTAGMTLRTGGRYGAGVYEHIDPASRELNHYLKDTQGKLYRGQYDVLDQTWRVFDERQPNARFRPAVSQLSAGRWSSMPAINIREQRLGIDQLVSKYAVSADLTTTTASSAGIYTLEVAALTPDSGGVFKRTTRHYIKQNGTVFEVKKGWLGRHWYLQEPNVATARTGTYKLRRPTESGVWEVKNRQADNTKQWQPLRVHSASAVPAVPQIPHKSFNSYDAGPEYIPALEKLTANKAVDFYRYAYRAADLESARQLVSRLQVKMYEDAKVFLAAFQMPHRHPLPEFAATATTKAIFTDLYKSYRGVLIGESHSASGGKKIIVDNLAQHGQNNVKTLYLEHLNSDLHQAHLDTFTRTGKLAPAVDSFLKRLDAGYFLNPSNPYSFSSMVRSAQKGGLQIIALDCVASYHPKGVIAPYPNTARYELFSYGASEIIRKHQAQVGPHNWIGLVGNSHANIFQGVPGLAELQNAIGLRVVDATPGSGQGIKRDCGFICKTGTFSKDVALLKNDFLLEVEVAGAPARATGLSTEQIEQKLTRGGMYLFDLDSEQWPVVIHRSSTGEVIRTSIQTDAQGKLFIERPTWQIIHQKRYSHLQALTVDLHAYGLARVE